MSLDEPTTALGDANLSAGLGDNLSEKQQFDAALREQVRLNAERATLNTKISKARKRFRLNGVKLGKLDATVRMLEWSPAEIRDDIAVTLRYATWAGFSVGSLAVPEGDQIDIFGHFDDVEVATADWRARGQADALRLKPAVVPDTCPQEHEQNYLEGHSSAWWSSTAADEEGA